ncbi:hypothetical protein ACFQU7_29125 [Pseudoroseomonas wenyumeiae]
MRTIIGSGPYKLSRLLAPQRLEAERAEHWDGPAPAIARLSYLAAGRGETRAAMAEEARPSWSRNWRRRRWNGCAATRAWLSTSVPSRAPG